MALIREETRPQVPKRKPPKVPVSKVEPAVKPTRRITYNTERFTTPGYVSAPGALQPGTIFDYTSPDFRFQLKPEARNYLANLPVRTDAIESSYNPLLGSINLASDATQSKAEHESIHALAVMNARGLGGPISRQVMSFLDPTFLYKLSPKKQAESRSQYFGTSTPNPLERLYWSGHKAQETPALLWEQMRHDPTQLPTIPSATPWFEQYFTKSTLGR